MDFERHVISIFDYQLLFLCQNFGVFLSYCSHTRGHQYGLGAIIIERMKQEELPKLYAVDNNTRYNKERVEALEAVNMVLVTEMVSKAALRREESRGAHFRTDFPQTDNENWLVNIVIKQEQNMMQFKYSAQK